MRGVVALFDEVSEVGDGGGLGLSRAEFGAHAVDGLDGGEEVIEFGEAGPAGELVGGGQEFGGDLVEIEFLIEEEGEGVEEGRRAMGSGQWAMGARRRGRLGGRFHAGNLPRGRREARGNRSMCHEFARAVGHCAKMRARRWSVGVGRATMGGEKGLASRPGYWRSALWAEGRLVTVLPAATDPYLD